MDKRKLIIFTVIGTAIIGFIAYSTYVVNLDEAITPDTIQEKEESTMDTMKSKGGTSLVEKHSTIGMEYDDLQRAYSNGHVSEKEYHTTIENLQQKELNVFEEARNYDWTDSEIKEQNYFFRGVMKFPSPLQTHSENDVPPVFGESKKQEYCKLMKEFDAAYTEFDTKYPVPEENSYETTEEYDKALSEYVSLRTNNAKFMELEERKAAFGNAAYIECN